jgi:CubicO group peptidase (beta-lactamase class C family)
MILALSACKKEQITNPTESFNLSHELKNAAPESQSINSEKLADAFQYAGNISGLRSFLVIRNGYIVGEEYFGFANADSIYFVRSVTKSVVSILIGIAIDKGFILDDQQQLSDIFNLDSMGIDEAKGNIKIRHLLTMTSGLEWDEFGGDNSASLQSGNLLNYVLNKDLVEEPGTVFNYNTGSTHILSAIISEATGMNALEFADEYLFNFLGIGNRFWYDDDHGKSIGGMGLMLQPRDMAKIGILFLNKGKSPKLCVSENWVNLSTNLQITLNYSFGSLNHFNYGYLWWNGHAGGFDYYTAWGRHGQFIFCIPELNLVVVTTSDIAFDPIVIDKQEADNLDLIVNYTLPSIRQ